MKVGTVLKIAVSNGIKKEIYGAGQFMLICGPTQSDTASNSFNKFRDGLPTTVRRSLSVTAPS